MSDVITIGSKKETETEDEKKLAQEEMAKQIAEDMVRMRFRTPFLQVYDEVTKKGKTLKQIIQEVNDKKSNLSALAREFVLNFKENRVLDWIENEEEFKERIKLKKQMSKK